MSGAPTDQKVVDQPIKCQRSKREIIETELSKIRSLRAGYVKSETLRLTSPRSCVTETDDVNKSGQGRSIRLRRRTSNADRNPIEKLRDVAARKSRDMERRLAGRRKKNNVSSATKSINFQQLSPIKKNPVRSWKELNEEVTASERADEAPPQRQIANSISFRSFRDQATPGSKKDLFKIALAIENENKTKEKKRPKKRVQVLATTAVSGLGIAAEFLSTRLRR